MLADNLGSANPDSEDAADAGVGMALPPTSSHQPQQLGKHAADAFELQDYDKDAVAGGELQVHA